MQENETQFDLATLPPVQLTPSQEELCQRLDEWHALDGLQTRPSDMFKGALYVTREECSSNPDRVSHAGNSLREIIYPFQSSRVLNKKLKAFTDYGSVTADSEFFQNQLWPLYQEVNDLAHHGVAPETPGFDFNGYGTMELYDLIQRFERVMREALTRQLDIHVVIDNTLMDPPTLLDDQAKNEQKLKEVQRLIELNFDSRHYFFEKADERWLDWLISNGFLDAIKQKSDDPTRYSYSTPELNYLVRMAAKEPKKVTDFILSFSISEENFNPETLSRFIHITSELPIDQIARLSSKIFEEEWVRLMGGFNDWGFEYEKMFQSLSNVNDQDSLLTIAKAVLSIKDKKTFDKGSKGHFKDNPFYFQDLSYSKVFQYLIEVDDTHVEASFEITCSAMSDIIKLGGKANDDDVFEYKDLFYLYDTDFFDLQLNSVGNVSDRDSVKALAATMKELAERLIGLNCTKESELQRIFETYVSNMPESSATWRFMLFVLSLCPKALKEPAQATFERIFVTIEAGQGYYPVDAGAEYKKSLSRCFENFDENYKKTYVENVFKYFGAELDDDREQQLYRRNGWRILSSICHSLTSEDKAKCKEIFEKECDESYEPEPSIGQVRGGMISPQGILSQEEFGQLPISEIVEKLKSEWRPEAMKELNTDENFTNPINAEGIGSQIKKDVTKRPQDYIDNASLFFERGVIDEHYTESFYRGIWDFIRSDRSIAQQCDWGNILTTISLVVQSGKESSFDFTKRERERFGGWLASWEGVHSVIADVLQELLNEINGKILLGDSFDRQKLLPILDYLLSNPDPRPQDEEIETAVSKIRLSGGDNEYLVSDPYSIAINSVRGRAFQAFALFTYQDSKRFGKNESVKIDSDTKELYEKVLTREDTRALMFLFGHYLPSFYFRDKEWALSLLAQIFPEDVSKQHLYIAAWEGYLANNLFEEVFFEPKIQELYQRGLVLKGDEDPGRRYFKEMDEGMATHLALAFLVYHKRFGFEDDLFKAFWSEKPERQAHFISFLGRMFVSGDNKQANALIEKEPAVKERLRAFWDWTIQNCDNPSLFKEYGFWISTEKGLFEPKWLADKVCATLQKTEGVMDWDRGLTKSIVTLANAAPEEALRILELYLLVGGVRGRNLRMPILHYEEWSDAVRILHNNPKTKTATYKLVNDLIEEGGSTFWPLEEIVK